MHFDVVKRLPGNSCESVRGILSKDLYIVGLYSLMFVKCSPGNSCEGVRGILIKSCFC